MFGQQLLWVGAMFLFGLWVNDGSVINVGIVFLGIYWLIMGTLMLGESPELSPRVQRNLPRTRLERMLFTWFNPGPGTGFIFAVSTGSVGISVMGILGTFLTTDFNSMSPPFVVSMIVAGYLMAFLGLTRLILLPFAKRFGHAFSRSISVMLIVLMVSILAPTAFQVITTGAVSMNYNATELSNWGWTIGHAFETTYDPFLALLILFAGLAILLPNLMILMREFRYGRIAVPQRVLEEIGRDMPPPPVEPSDPLA
jgi:hypothetical protein